MDKEKTLEECLNDLKNAIQDSIHPFILFLEKIMRWIVNKLEKRKKK